MEAATEPVGTPSETPSDALTTLEFIGRSARDPVEGTDPDDELKKATNFAGSAREVLGSWAIQTPNGLRVIHVTSGITKFGTQPVEVVLKTVSGASVGGTWKVARQRSALPKQHYTW